MCSLKPNVESKYPQFTEPDYSFPIWKDCENSIERYALKIRSAKEIHSFSSLNRPTYRRTHFSRIAIFSRVRIIDLHYEST